MSTPPVTVDFEYTDVHLESLGHGSLRQVFTVTAHQSDTLDRTVESVKVQLKEPPLVFRNGQGHVLNLSGVLKHRAETSAEPGTYTTGHFDDGTSVWNFSAFPIDQPVQFSIVYQHSAFKQ